MRRKRDREVCLCYRIVGQLYTWQKPFIYLSITLSTGNVTLSAFPFTNVITFSNPFSLKSKTKQNETLKIQAVTITLEWI